MPVKVVDASAVAAVLFDEETAEAVFERLRGFSLAAPAVWVFELANVCWKKARRDPTQSAALTAAFAERNRFLIQEEPVDFDAVLELAGRRGLTAYDASYLWLARQLGVELVTLDRRLAQAAV